MNKNNDLDEGRKAIGHHTRSPAETMKESNGTDVLEGHQADTTAHRRHVVIQGMKDGMITMT